MAPSVSANFPGPASFMAATRNSYGRPSTRPRTVSSVDGTSPTDALQQIQHIAERQTGREKHWSGVTILERIGIGF